jgi:hypothetical protein
LSLAEYPEKLAGKYRQMCLQLCARLRELVYLHLYLLLNLNLDLYPYLDLCLNLNLNLNLSLFRTFFASSFGSLFESKNAGP